MRSSRLTVEREGVVTLPAEVCEIVGLRPGDILAVKVRYPGQPRRADFRCWTSRDIGADAGELAHVEIKESAAAVRRR